MEYKYLGGTFGSHIAIHSLFDFHRAMPSSKNCACSQCTFGLIGSCPFVDCSNCISIPFSYFVADCCQDPRNLTRRSLCENFGDTSCYSREDPCTDCHSEHLLVEELRKLGISDEDDWPAAFGELLEAQGLSLTKEVNHG